MDKKTSERAILNHILGYLDGMAAALTLCGDITDQLVNDISDEAESARACLDALRLSELEREQE